MIVEALSKGFYMADSNHSIMVSMAVTLSSTRNAKERVLCDVIGSFSAALPSRVCIETTHIVLPNTTYSSQRGALGSNDEHNITPFITHI